MTIDDIRNELRKSITIDKLAEERDHNRKSLLPMPRSRNFFEKNQESFNLPESYHIAHILVTPVARSRTSQWARMTTPRALTRPARKPARLLKDIQGRQGFWHVA